MSTPAPLPFPYAHLGVRLLALYFILQGIWDLLSNLFTSIHEFDPSYLGFYFRSQALSPLLGMLVGLAVWMLSAGIARRVVGSKGE